MFGSEKRSVEWMPSIRIMDDLSLSLVDSNSMYHDPFNDVTRTIPQATCFSTLEFQPSNDHLHRILSSHITRTSVRASPLDSIDADGKSLPQLDFAFDPFCVELVSVTDSNDILFRTSAVMRLDHVVASATREWYLHWPRVPHREAPVLQYPSVAFE